MRRVAMIVLLAACGAACSDGGTVVSVAGSAPTWSVGGGFLRDAQGRAVVLRGANVSGKDKYAPYFDFRGPADFARMRDDWGLNAVRFVMPWAAIEPQEGVYDDTYLDGVADRIGWARDADLAVVVDMHQDVYGEGFAVGGGDGAPLWTCAQSNYASFTPTQPWALENLEAGVTACWDDFWHGASLRSHFAEAWRRVAARLAPFDNIVGFDVFNEPYWGSHAITHFEPDLLGSFYEQMVPVVRSAAPGWVAFLEPSSARNLGGTTYLPMPTFGDYVYAPHSYDTGSESGMGFDPSHAPAVVANIQRLAAEAKALDAPLWIGEYGGPSTESGIVDYMTAQYDGAGQVAASTMYWDYTKGGYGLLAPDGSEAQPLLDTIVRPYPERVAGTPVSWSFDASTSTFTFRYRSSSAITAPTILSVPARLYPQGYVVDCGGCASTPSTGSLTLTTPPKGDPAVVTLRPKT